MTIQMQMYNTRMTIYKKYNRRMTLQLQKVQYTYGNTTAKSTIQACQYN